MTPLSFASMFLALGPALQERPPEGNQADLERAIRALQEQQEEQQRRSVDLESMQRAIENATRQLEIQRQTLEKLLEDTRRRVEETVGPALRDRYDALKEVDAERFVEAAKRLRDKGEHAVALEEMLRAQAARAKAESGRLRDFLESGEFQERMGQWSENFQRRWNEGFGEEWQREMENRLRDRVPPEAEEAIAEALDRVREMSPQIREDVERSVRRSLERAFRDLTAPPAPEPQVHPPHPPGAPHAPAPHPAPTLEAPPMAPPAPRARDAEQLRRMNEDLRGEIHQLRDELARLRAELDQIRSAARGRAGGGDR